MPNIERVAEDDPMRCQATMKTGQCMNKATTKGGTCLAHGGNSILEAQANKRIRNYKLAKFQSALDRHADSPRLKSLNDEVAILRMMLEEQLNQCKDEHDLMLQSHQISDLVVKIEKLVKSCHNLESSLGMMLDKQAILSFAQKVIDIVSEQTLTEEQLTSISNGILQAVGDIGTLCNEEDDVTYG